MVTPLLSMKVARNFIISSENEFMNHLKNPLIIGGVVAFIVVATLGWNYTETIKAKNEVERERIASEERVKSAELIQKQNEVEIAQEMKKTQEDKDIEQEKIQAQQPKPVISLPTLSQKQNQPEDSALKIERCKVSAQQLVDIDKKNALPAIMQLARESCVTYPDGTDLCFLHKAAMISELKKGEWEKLYQQYYANCLNQ